MYFNFQRFYIVNSRTNLARKKSAKAGRNFASAYKIFYMLCKTMVFLPFFPRKKRRKPSVYGPSPLRQYKDTTISREIQIALTYRNNLRNVKRRVLHTRGSPLYYITRELRSLVSGCPFWGRNSNSAPLRACYSNGRFINQLAMSFRLSCRRFLFFVRERSGLRDRMKTKRYGAKVGKASKLNRKSTFH